MWLFYYYQGDQYNCTNIDNCPKNYQLEIKEKKKCIDKYENVNTYTNQYNGECYKETPESTIYVKLLKYLKILILINVN